MSETFGQRFARLRKAKGLTQDEVAAKVNVSSQAVSKWENDINMPDVGILLKLAGILGVTADELLGAEIPVPAKFEPQTVKTDFSKLMLRIIIDTEDGEKVRCNFPLQLVKIALDANMAPSIGGNSKINETMKTIDWKKLYSMVEQGLLGEILSVDAQDGTHIRIVVE